MNAAPNSRLIIIFSAQTTRRAQSMGRCRDQIRATGSLAAIINITNATTRIKYCLMRNMATTPLRPTYWKFGLLCITPVILLVLMECTRSQHRFLDIAGGSVPNGTWNSLARIPLRWMIRNCLLANTGIQFYRKTFKHIGLDPNTLPPFVVTRPSALKTSASCVAEARASAHGPGAHNVKDGCRLFGKGKVFPLPFPFEALALSAILLILFDI